MQYFDEWRRQRKLSSSRSKMIMNNLIDTIIVAFGPRGNTIIGAIGYVPSLLCRCCLEYLVHRHVPPECIAGNKSTAWRMSRVVYCGYWVLVVASCAYAVWHVQACLGIWARGTWNSFPMSIFMHVLFLATSFALSRLTYLQYSAMHRIWAKYPST